MPSSIISSASRPFSAKILSKSNINNDIYNKQYLHLKNKFKKIKNRINETIEKVSNASMDINRDIYDSKNYDKLYKLEEKIKTKKLKKDKIINVKKINNNRYKNIDKLNNDLYKFLDLEKNVENKMINGYKYYDKKGKKLMMQIMAQDKSKDHFLNKNHNSKNLILNNRYYLKKLKKEFNILGADILATKKKYKGVNAIEPSNDVIFLHKLIKENMLNNLSNDEYLDEVIRRKSIESLSNKIKKRLLYLQQKSLSIKNKIRESDYLYL